MKIVYKKIGETPLECLERYREENLISPDEKISYIGRLDPMAEGEMILIFGEENKNREKYLSFDKTYSASILLGISTDTGDILGFLNNQAIYGQDFDIDSITNTIYGFKDLSQQKYPWFSSKTINGKSLFHWFKNNLTHLIDRPTRKIKIYNVENVHLDKIKSEDLKYLILNRILLASGDFRQDETIQKWQNFFDQNLMECFYIVNFDIKVSTGTYIRALTEEIVSKNKMPAVLLNLKRTKIHI